MKRKDKEQKRSAMRDRVRKRAEEREKQGTGGGTKYTLPEGREFFQMKKRFSIDIVPYVVSVDDNPDGVPKGEYWYRRLVLVHRGIGAEDKSYICPKTIHKKCPICEHRAELAKQTDADEKVLAALKAKERELFNVYDHDDTDKGVQLWDVSPYLFGRKLEEEVREGDESYASFAEPEDGMTLKVRATEEKFQNNVYFETSRIDFEEREALDEEILEQTLDLDTIIKVLPYETLEKIFLELEDEPADKSKDDDEEEETPKSKKMTSHPEKSLKKKCDEDEDEDEEEAPKKTASKKDPKKDDKNKCPHGGKFGKDCDELDECEDCEIWEACIEASEEN